jgi:hypothetical protein
VTATHVYRHPAGHDLGRHHAGEDISGRPAQPPQYAAGLQAAAALFNATPEQWAPVAEFLGRSMSDLDMPDGTQVEAVEHWGPHESGCDLLWTDKNGDARRTHVSDEQLAEHFEPAGSKS